MMTEADVTNVQRRPTAWIGRTVDPLAALAAEPTCAAAQADGGPCEESGRDCERCLSFLQHRDRMRAREGPW
jgi:hypothetical protein